jgi:hypothetical protein
MSDVQGGLPMLLATSSLFTVSPRSLPAGRSFWPTLLILGITGITAVTLSFVDRSLSAANAQNPQSDGSNLQDQSLQDTRQMGPGATGSGRVDTTIRRREIVTPRQSAVASSSSSTSPMDTSRFDPQSSLGQNPQIPGGNAPPQ